MAIRSSKKMRLVIPFFVVLICLLLVPPVAFGAAKLTITSSTLKNSVTLDGKWTYADEWIDGVSFDCGGYGWIALKDDAHSLYVLVDYTKDTSAAAGDFAGVIWDQKNDGGFNPKSDDYDPIISYTNKTNYTSSVRQGTGTGWGTLNPASSLDIAAASSTNATNDPYSHASHVVYEFRIPRSILDNSTVITSIGFYAVAQNAATGIWIALPRSGDYRTPDSWAQLTFSLPVPEFPSALIMVLVSVAAAGFVSRRRRQTHGGREMVTTRLVSSTTSPTPHVKKVIRHGGEASL